MFTRSSISALDSSSHAAALTSLFSLSSFFSLRRPKIFLDRDLLRDFFSFFALALGGDSTSSLYLDLCILGCVRHVYVGVRQMTYQLLPTMLIPFASAMR